jgi:hypothetical protein
LLHLHQHLHQHLLQRQRLHQHLHQRQRLHLSMMWTRTPLWLRIWRGDGLGEVPVGTLQSVCAPTQAPIFCPLYLGLIP